MAGNFHGVLSFVFFLWFICQSQKFSSTKINVSTIICAGRHTGSVVKHRCRPTAVPSNCVSVCYHCHPADSIFDPRDVLVHAISSNVLVKKLRGARSH